MRIQRSLKRRLTLEVLEARVVPAGIGKTLLATPTVATTSSNWSGYAVETSLQTPQSGAVSAVSADWTVPAVSGSGTGYSSVWVGIDGYNSSTVEQIGTEQDLSRGTPSYSAWYELYPQEAEVPISGMTIAPGDKIAASVNIEQAPADSGQTLLQPLAAAAGVLLFLAEGRTAVSEDFEKRARRRPRK